MGVPTPIKRIRRSTPPPALTLESRVLTIRGEKVLLDSDLALIYGVSTKVLNQAVKRHVERFPPDFRFQLTRAERTEVVTTCDHLRPLKFSPVLPWAFTEHGAVKRHVERFPPDFRFQLTRAERTEVVTTCDHLRPLKSWN